MSRKRVPLFENSKQKEYFSDWNESDSDSWSRDLMYLCNFSTISMSTRNMGKFDSMKIQLLGNVRERYKSLDQTLKKLFTQN